MTFLRTSPVSKYKFSKIETFLTIDEIKQQYKVMYTKCHMHRLFFNNLLSPEVHIKGIYGYKVFQSQFGTKLLNPNQWEALNIRGRFESNESTPKQGHADLDLPWSMNFRQLALKSLN